MKSKKLEKVDTTGKIMLGQDVSIAPALTIVVGNPCHLAECCMRTHSVLCDIRDCMFTLSEKWERDWNAQSKKGTRYYCGTPRCVSAPGRKGKLYPVRGYCFQWKPGKRELTAWAIEDPKTKVTMTLWPTIGSELSKLIRRRVRS